MSAPQVESFKAPLAKLLWRMKKSKAGRKKSKAGTKAGEKVDFWNFFGWIQEILEFFC
jgi:hypothetical protein